MVEDTAITIVKREFKEINTILFWRKKRSKHNIGRWEKDLTEKRRWYMFGLVYSTYLVSIVGYSLERGLT
jgi:hypothetical protein